MRAEVENAAFTPSDSLRLRFNPDTPSTEPKSPAFSQLARGQNAPLLAKSQQNANVAIFTPEPTRIGPIGPAQSISPTSTSLTLPSAKARSRHSHSKPLFEIRKSWASPPPGSSSARRFSTPRTLASTERLPHLHSPQDELAVHSAQDNIDLLLAALYRIRAPPVPHLKRQYIQPALANLPQEPLSVRVLKHVSHIRWELAGNNPSSHLVGKSCLYGRLILAPKAVGEAKEVIRHLIPNLSGFP